MTNFCLALASLGTVAISSLDDALTFARIGAGAPTVLAVRSWNEGRIEAVDLSRALGRPIGDPISLFLEHGYDGTTMRGIAQAAGVSVGNAYYYFDSKEHLIQEYSK